VTHAGAVRWFTEVLNMPNYEMLPSRIGANPFSLFRRDVDSLFDSFFRSNGLPLAEAPQGAALFPTLNVSENNEGFRITADLPGLERKDVTLSIEGDRLVLFGSRTEEKDEKGRNWHRRERSSGEFRREIEFPCEIDASKASAVMRHGLLTIDLPKRPEATQKRRLLEITQG
jgi:HSP20 family protein